MATTIVTKKGSGAPAASDLVEGELAVDTTNGRLYTENSSAAVVELGSNPSGNITFADNGKAIFGAGSDLQIYHDGSHSVIADFGTGDLRLNGVSVEMRSAATGASYLRANNAGSVDVYHNGSAKLATTNTGIDVTGTATMDGLTVSDGTETTSIPATADRLSFTGASLNYIQSAGSLFVQPTGDLVLNGSGAEIMRLKSGNAGIGTSSPNVSLEVDGGTANGSIARFHNNGDRYLELSAESDGTYDDAISVFKKNSSVGQFAFRNPTTEYMRIDSSGRVGIGTASPSYPLTIHNTGDGIKFEVSDTVDANYRIQVSGSNIVTGPSTSSAYIFQTGNTERARIDSSGNVGIGTTSPSYKMSLRDDSTSSYPLSLENNNIGTAGVHTGIRFGYVGNTYQKGAIIFESQDGSGRGKMYFALEGTANSSNADETDAKMTIDYDGNVGIGTSSPDAPLTVNAGSDNLVGMFESSDTLSYISFKDSGTTSDTSVALGASGDNFTVYTGSSFGSERMRIDSSGNLLVGSTSDSGTDYHYLKSDGFVRHKRAGGIVGVFDRGTSDGDIVNFRKDGTTVGSIGVENGVDLTVGNADTGLRFVAGDNAIWPFNMSTGTDRDNAVSLGVSGARFKDAYLSGGIYLGGTAAANKLYDYEEGTFTPFFAHGNSPVDVGSSYAYQTGVYRKVGNVVYYIIDMDATISTTATGYVSVHGLPFTSANSNVSRFPVATDRDCHSLTVPSGSILSVWVNANTTHLYIQSKSLTSNNSSNMTSWDSSGRFNVSGFYFTS